MERANHSSRAGCSRRRTEAHRIASSAGLRVPRVSWQVCLSLLYLWYAAAIGRSWTGRAPVGSAAKRSPWREVTLKSPVLWEDAMGIIRLAACQFFRHALAATR